MILYANENWLEISVTSAGTNSEMRGFILGSSSHVFFAAKYFPFLRFQQVEQVYLNN